MRRFLLLLSISLWICAPVFSQFREARRYVCVQTAVVKETTGFFARDVGTLSLGDEVIMLREAGKWTEVLVGDLVGWVTSTSLSVRRVVRSGAAIGATELAMAGKGFSPDMELEYRRNGLDYSVVDAMESMTIPREELLRFITEGGLARGDH